ncbi:MAG: hypothetical protein CW338_11220 [Clostridiales bacterium]|nr:hypothetical protein [Clostridiales bacterium]
MKDNRFVCKENIVNHFRYHWYLYALALIAAIVIPTIVFSVSNYESPADQRVDFFFINTGNYESLVKPVFDRIVSDSAAENVESLTYEFIDNDSSGTMEQVVSLRIAVGGEKDIIFSDSTIFTTYAAQGVFIPLENVIPAELLSNPAINSGYVYCESDGNSHLYGIPVSVLPGLTNTPPYLFDSLYISVYINNGNDKNVMAVIDQLIEYGLTSTPETEQPQ